MKLVYAFCQWLCPYLSESAARPVLGFIIGCAFEVRRLLRLVGLGG